MWVVMRGRESVKNVFFFYLLQYVFLREIRKEVCMWEWWWERIREVWELSFFSVLTECVFILAPCNINTISALIVMNNIRKELVMIATHYENQITANQTTKSIIINNKLEHKIILINNIDSYHLKRYCF